MSVMKKDVNFVFFILIIATVVSFAGFTAYYQVSFRSINDEYNTKLAELNKVSQDLIEKKSTLLQTTEVLNETQTKIVEKEGLYKEIKDERDSLKSERDTLKENLFQTRSELAQKTSQAASLSAQLDVATRKVADLKADRDYYEGKYDECKDQLEE